jgi:hypothetical protein
MGQWVRAIAQDDHLSSVSSQVTNLDQPSPSIARRKSVDAMALPGRAVTAVFLLPGKFN